MICKELWTSFGRLRVFIDWKYIPSSLNGSWNEAYHTIKFHRCDGLLVYGLPVTDLVGGVGDPPISARRPEHAL